MDNRVAEFSQENRSWQDRLCGHQLHLAIPSTILDYLGETKGRAAWWGEDGERWAQELDFSRMVEEVSGGIGVRNGTIVRFPPLDRQVKYSGLLTEALIKDMGWEHEIDLEQTRKALEEAEAGKLPAIRLRILGYAGWLVTNPKYRVELENIRRKHKELDLLLPFNWSGEEKELSHDETVLDIEAFLAKWGLTALTDWYFPCPQGPLYGAHDVLRFIQDTRFPGIALYIPAWYAILDDKDGILEELKSQQKEWFKHLLASESEDWPIKNYSSYSGIFLCHYALEALKSRGRLPRKKDSEYGDIMSGISIWLHKIAPEKRGGANRGTAEGGAENHDTGSRARRLIDSMNKRLRDTVKKHK